MRTLAFLLLTSCLGLSLFGQQAPTASPTPASAHTDQQALPADAPSHEQMLKLINAMETRKQMYSMMQTMRKSMEDMRKSQSPELSDKKRKALDALQTEFYGKLNSEDQIDKMLEAIIPIYQRHFTKSDVDGLIAFYSSPLGKKMQQEQPQILKEYMPQVMALTQKHVEETMQEIDYEPRYKQILSSDDDELETHDQDKDPQKSK